ncbi:hypothetical protein CC1G_08437 [Coprinopsis cinerea okayama7|uniref:F-box domain-containing protein n=1 Tax=Coprinopsis cinerea (strain Okayama-7 / 130 / ATCC MYA-4618 / FGSC 9003) TaxID=240176 RepID=A8NLX1_COPC7|nr:hypothetical protein CC1G_08437 [Coprinopsis cinerea okayama7\|eukprot:XP_001834792.2 hypothetical protein CC1G_08437 [Coprinopsis cinerea okayama7\
MEATAHAGSTSHPARAGSKQPPVRGRLSKPAQAGLILRRRGLARSRRTRRSSPGDSPGGRTYSETRGMHRSFGRLILQLSSSLTYLDIAGVILASPTLTSLNHLTGLVKLKVSLAQQHVAHLCSSALAYPRAQLCLPSLQQLTIRVLPHAFQACIQLLSISTLAQLRVLKVKALEDLCDPNALFATLNERQMFLLEEIALERDESFGESDTVAVQPPQHLYGPPPVPLTEEDVAPLFSFKKLSLFRIYHCDHYKSAHQENLLGNSRGSCVGRNSPAGAG